VCNYNQLSHILKSCDITRATCNNVNLNNAFRSFHEDTCENNPFARTFCFICIYCIFFCRGFFRSDRLLGTVMVKLQPLESRCVLHDSFPVNILALLICLLLYICVCVYTRARMPIHVRARASRYRYKKFHYIVSAYGWQKSGRRKIGVETSPQESDSV